MPAEKTQGFVLRRRDFRDTSLLANFYTRDFGKVTAVLKAAKIERSRFGSSLDLFSLNEITLYFRKRSDLHLVTSTELVENFPTLRRDLSSLGWACYLLELLDEMTETGSFHPRIFHLLKEALGVLGTSSDAPLVASCFEMKLLQELGQGLELKSCVRCSEVLQTDVFFSVPSGGILCRRCRSGEGPLIGISQGVVECLRGLRNLPIADSVKASWEISVREKARSVLRSFVDHHLRAKPRTLVFLEKVQAETFFKASGESQPWTPLLASPA